MREDGGTVCVGKFGWNGVRLATSVVLKRWPPAIRPEHSPHRSDAKKAVSVTELKKCLQRAGCFLSQEGYSSLTRDEAEKLLEKVFPSSVRARRREAAKTIAATEKRRTQRQLSSRNNELERCRQFLETAA
jgi:hypothetical protein